MKPLMSKTVFVMLPYNSENPFEGLTENNPNMCLPVETKNHSYTNNNGEIDTAFIDDDEDGIIEAILIDDNENRVWEILYFDEDLDGNPDILMMDRDEDGKVDVVAYDYDQDGEWDKYEKVS